jgi:hypothetical protein
MATAAVGGGQAPSPYLDQAAREASGPAIGLLASVQGDPNRSGPPAGSQKMAVVVVIPAMTAAVTSRWSRNGNDQLARCTTL